jgi:hypothetical protein
MNKLMIGVSGLGVLHTDASVPDTDTKFRMVKESDAAFNIRGLNRKRGNGTQPGRNQSWSLGRQRSGTCWRITRPIAVAACTVSLWK